jgi:hypothetical protein
MRKANIQNYYSTNDQRVSDCTVAIFDHITPADWARIPQLCEDFFQHFESCLSLTPMRDEVWFYAKETHVVDLDKAEEFITDWFFPED